MLDQKKVFLGIAPIGWTNDDMPELGAENTFEQCISEMALAGFSGTEIGNKYPSDAAVLKHKLDVRGMRIASRWFSSFLVTKPLEENVRAFTAELDFLAAVGASCINVSEQSYSIQGMQTTPIFGNKYVMNETEWKLLCDGLSAAAVKHGIAFSAQSVGGMFGLYFRAHCPRNFSEVMQCDTAAFNRFFHAMLEAGHYFAPSAYEAGFVSAAHSEADIAATIDAAAAIFRNWQ